MDSSMAVLPRCCSTFDVCWRPVGVDAGQAIAGHAKEGLGGHGVVTGFDIVACRASVTAPPGI